MRRFLAVLAVAAAACSGEAGPVAGELAIRLTTPRSTDRALMFVLTGRQSGVTAAPASGYLVFAKPASAGDTTRIVVAAPAGRGIAAGEVARISVADDRAVSAYAVRLSDVAAANYAVGDTTGVSLSVVKP
ncbi:MAG TPA: hypothetical protein VMF70_14630 [Gemmatimonadales bacterium]|nr:hypothetical protein [Gemmatimonadales bacterium]